MIKKIAIGSAVVAGISLVAIVAAGDKLKDDQMKHLTMLLAASAILSPVLFLANNLTK